MQARPNILFICTDQQRYDALGCYGNESIMTPAIDQLATEGVLFERCYVQSPICAPSRASLLTGRYPSAHGLWANGVALPPHEQLFTRALADAGYDCGLIGKLHLAAAFGGRREPRPDDGFRFWRWAHDPYHGAPENQYHRWLEARYPELYAAARSPASDVRFETLPADAHYSHWVAEETIEFLSSARDPAKPFFLMVNFFDPHHPFGAPPEYVRLYDPARLPRPISAPGELASKPPILAEASRESYGGYEPGFTSYSAEEIQEIVAAYYAMMTLIDDEVRRILATVQELGLREETLVVFTSDHGDFMGDHQLLLKGALHYRGLVRVPFIWRDPNVDAQGLVNRGLCGTLDIANTVLARAELQGHNGMQGANLLQAVNGGATGHDSLVIEEHQRRGYMGFKNNFRARTLITEDVRLTLYEGADWGEMYDLTK
ncbi:MAG: sulfatase family protein, partial [Ardenticatenaceae bacterium]